MGEVTVGPRQEAGDRLHNGLLALVAFWCCPLCHPQLHTTGLRQCKKEHKRLSGRAWIMWWRGDSTAALCTHTDPAEAVGNALEGGQSALQQGMGWDIQVPG